MGCSSIIYKTLYFSPKIPPPRLYLLWARWKVNEEKDDYTEYFCLSCLNYKEENLWRICGEREWEDSLSPIIEKLISKYGSPRPIHQYKSNIRTYRTRLICLLVDIWYRYNQSASIKKKLVYSERSMYHTLEKRIYETCYYWETESWSSSLLLIRQILRY